MALTPRGRSPVPFRGVQSPGSVLPADLLGTSLPHQGGVPTPSPGGRETTQAIQIFPWWERPPKGFLNVWKKEQALVLAAAVGVTVLGPSVVVPAGYSWVLRGINIFVQNPTASFNVQYILRAAQSALGDPYSTFGRVADSVEVPFPILEYGVGPTTLDVLITNLSANAWTVGAALSGWMAPTVNCNRTEAEF